MECNANGAESRRYGADNDSFWSGVQGYESTVKGIIQTYDGRSYTTRRTTCFKMDVAKRSYAPRPAGNIKPDKEKSIEKSMELLLL